MTSKKFLILFCMASCLPVVAQHTNREGMNLRDSHFVESYMDSLAQHRPDTMSSDMTPQIGFSRFTPSPTYARLFLPLAYYKNVSHRMLSLDSDMQKISPTELALERALLSVYMNHPQLVSTTQSKLDIIGPTLEVGEQTRESHPDLVEQVAPTPIEPDLIAAAPIIHKPNFWTFSGDYYLQFLQNYVSSNWYKAGESSYSMVGAVTLQANYNNKQKVKWDNKLELKLGLQTSRGDSLHSLKTSEDLIRYTGKLGFQATKKWYYTIQLIAYTQFMRGYASNNPFVFSDFMSPFGANLSVGMDYTVDFFKKKLTGTVHLAPAAYNFKYVSRLALAPRFGLDEGKHQLHDIGSEITVDLNWKFSDMISWKTRLYGYTTYSRTELEWENTFVFKFNRYISTNIFIYPRFDDGSKRDNHHGYWQLKEYASLGFAYSF
ncbi:hypothetical protein HMPREF0671_02260 [Prevotella sp. S7 MS 2]|nr:hypothetical protein HMPREF0671_02260 [Prevotella sp. S7 MS 2]